MDFTSSVEAVDEVTKKILVTIPATIVSERVTSELGKVSRSAQIKGFRAGKAPKQMVEKLYGESVRLDTANKLINSSLSDVVKNEKFEVVGSPEVEITTFENGKDITYTATVYLFPSPKVTGYDKIDVEVSKREVKEEELEKALEEMRASRATMRKLELRNTAKFGDVIDVALTVEVDGQKGDRPEPLVVSLGEKKLPEEVEKGIEGMEVGTSREIEATVPVPPGAGDPSETKKALYRITLNALFEKILPELNDELAKSLNMGVETVLELRIKLREEFERQQKEGEKTDIQVALLDKLVAANEFKVPQVLIDDEVRALIVRAGLMDESKASTTDIEPFRKGLSEVAIKRVKSSIIIDRIGEAEKIKAEKEDIDKEIESLAARSGVSVDYARNYLMEKGRIVGIVMEVTRQKVLDFLAGKTEVKYVDAPATSEA